MINRNREVNCGNIVNSEFKRIRSENSIAENMVNIEVNCEEYGNNEKNWSERGKQRA